MKTLPAPDVLIRAWLHDPHAITVAAFAISGVFFSVAAWQIQRNLRHNEPGLRLPLALPFALTISAFGLFAANPAEQRALEHRPLLLCERAKFAVRLGAKCVRAAAAGGTL